MNDRVFAIVAVALLWAVWVWQIVTGRVSRLDVKRSEAAYFFFACLAFQAFLSAVITWFLLKTTVTP